MLADSKARHSNLSGIVASIGEHCGNVLHYLLLPAETEETEKKSKKTAGVMLAL